MGKEPLLPSRCVATDVLSDSDIQAFMRHATIRIKYIVAMRKFSLALGLIAVVNEKIQLV
jgi:hypothetical protein